MEITMIQENLKQLPRLENNLCFGCSPENPSGLQMKFFTDEECVVSWLSVKEHMCGWSDMVHGGIICTILDEVMSWASIYLLKKIILTKNISVDFLRPVFLSDELRAEARVVSKNGTREATMEGRLYNAAGELCARSSANFALMDAADARRFDFFSEEMLRAFSAFLGAAG